MISVLPPQSPVQLSSLSAHVGPAPGPGIWCGCYCGHSCPQLIPALVTVMMVTDSPQWDSGVPPRPLLPFILQYCKLTYFTFCPFSPFFSPVKCVDWLTVHCPKRICVHGVCPGQRSASLLSHKYRRNPAKCRSPISFWFVSGFWEVILSLVNTVDTWHLATVVSQPRRGSDCTLTLCRSHCSPLHSHCANRFIEVGIPLEVNWIIGISAQNDCHSQLSLQFSNWKLVSSLLFSWHWRHVQDVFITLLPPSHHCRQCCLSRHFAHHHLFISHYFRCDEFSPRRHVSGGRGLVAGRVTDNGLHQFYWTETRYYVTSQEYLHNNIGIFPVSEAVRTNVPCHTSAKIKLSTSVQLFLARKILWMKAK